MRFRLIVAPVAVAQPARSRVGLAAGVEHRQRVVSVKPHHGGTEFALVYVATSD